MKLKEMIGYKKYQIMSLQEILSSIVEDNQGSIHSGEFGFVLDIGQDYVYKCWLNDPAYEKFIEYCMQHQENIHLPKILSKKIITIPIFFKRKAGISGKLKVIKIEKLVEKKFSIYDDGESVGLSSLNAYINSLEDYDSVFDNHWFGEDNELISTQLDVMKSIKGINSDLGPNNIMFRGNIKVLSDPINHKGWTRNKMIRMPHLLDRDTMYDPDNVSKALVSGRGEGTMLHTKMTNPSVSDLINLANECFDNDISEKQMYDFYKNEMFALMQDVDKESETFEECYYVFKILRKFWKKDFASLTTYYKSK